MDATLVRLCLPAAAARIRPELCVRVAGSAHQLLTLDVRGLEVWYEAPAQRAEVGLPFYHAFRETPQTVLFFGCI